MFRRQVAAAAAAAAAGALASVVSVGEFGSCGALHGLSQPRVHVTSKPVIHRQISLDSTVTERFLSVADLRSDVEQYFHVSDVLLCYVYAA